MRCGLDCMEYLLNYYQFEDLIREKIINEMNEHLNENGISIYDFICIANRHHLICRAIKSLWIPKKIPCVLYFKKRCCYGHFVMLVERKKFHFIIYDPMLGYKQINKIWLYLFWSHICILCYN